MRILHRGPEHCFLYHLICSLIGRSPIFRARYLYRVSTKCCQIFNTGKGHNYLGGKPPKFAIYEILSLLILVNNRKLFQTFTRKPPRNTVFWGLPPLQPACGQHELNSMLLEPFISKLSCL